MAGWTKFHLVPEQVTKFDCLTEDDSLLSHGLSSVARRSDFFSCFTSLRPSQAWLVVCASGGAEEPAQTRHCRIGGTHLPPTLPHPASGKKRMQRFRYLSDNSRLRAISATLTTTKLSSGITLHTMYYDRHLYNSYIT
jgi:hypothetical protein